MESQNQQITQIKKELDKQARVDNVQEEEIRELKEEIVRQKERTSYALNLSFKAMKELERETKKQVGTALMAAFGFLIALVWRDVITTYTTDIIRFLRIPAESSLEVLYVAGISTIIAVIGIVVVGIWVPKKEEILKEVATG